MGNAVRPFAEGYYIDLNGPGWTQSAGSDITAALNAAIPQLLALPNPGGTIVLDPVPATNPYLLDGAGQSGTALGYGYNGQVLFPAFGSLNLEATIRIKGRQSVSLPNVADDAAPYGAIVSSNAGAGVNAFDMVPNFTAFGAEVGWSGIQPVFEDVIILEGSNPQGGGISTYPALRAAFRGLAIIADTSNAALTGTGTALILPQASNSENVVLDGVQLRGFPNLLQLSEHAVLNGVYLSRGLNAFVDPPNNHGSHVNWFGKVDVNECVTVFKVRQGLYVYGLLDWENVAGGAFQQGPLVSEVAAGALIGALWINYAGGGAQGGMPLGAFPGTGQGLDVAMVAPSFRVNAPVSGGSITGWKGKHPHDNFSRAVAIAAGNAGQAWPSLHPAVQFRGSVNVAAQALTASTTPATHAYAAKDGGVSRAITVSGVFGPAPNLTIFACEAYGGAGYGTPGISVWVTSVIHPFVHGGVSLATLPGPAANSAYTIRLEIFYEQGIPALFRLFLNGALIYTYALSAAQRVAANFRGASWPFTMDGIDLGDTGTTVTLFDVDDISSDPAASTLIVATTARAALHYETTLCTSGTFTVTLPSPAANVVNVVTNTGAGTITVAPPSGTLSNLSGATGNITLAQGTKATIVSDGTNFLQVA